MQRAMNIARTIGELLVFAAGAAVLLLAASTVL